MSHSDQAECSALQSVHSSLCPPDHLHGFIPTSPLGHSWGLKNWPHEKLGPHDQPKVIHWPSPRRKHDDRYETCVGVTDIPWVALDYLKA